MPLLCVHLRGRRVPTQRVSRQGQQLDSHQVAAVHAGKRAAPVKHGAAGVGDGRPDDTFAIESGQMVVADVFRVPP